MEVQYQRFNSNQSGNCSVTPLPLPQSLYGRADGRTYGHVITKFSRLGGLPNFLTHGAPLARFARWSSAIKSGKGIQITFPLITIKTYTKLTYLRIPLANAFCKLHKRLRSEPPYCHSGAPAREARQRSTMGKKIW